MSASLRDSTVTATVGAKDTYPFARRPVVIVGSIPRRTRRVSKNDRPGIRWAGIPVSLKSGIILAVRQTAIIGRAAADMRMKRDSRWYQFSIRTMLIGVTMPRCGLRVSTRRIGAIAGLAGPGGPGLVRGLFGGLHARRLSHIEGRHLRAVQPHEVQRFICRAVRRFDVSPRSVAVDLRQQLPRAPGLWPSVGRDWRRRPRCADWRRQTSTGLLPPSIPVRR